MRVMDALSDEELAAIYRNNGTKLKGEKMQKYIQDQREQDRKAYEQHEQAVACMNMACNMLWDIARSGIKVPNVQGLKESIYDMAQMMTQKGMGNRKDSKKSWINADEDLEPVILNIVMECAALVFTGQIDTLESMAKTEEVSA